MHILRLEVTLSIFSPLEPAESNFPSMYGFGDKVYEFNRELAAISKKIAGKRA